VKRSVNAGRGRLGGTDDAPPTAMHRAMVLVPFAVVCACGASPTRREPVAPTATVATTATSLAPSAASEACVLLCGTAVAVRVEAATPDYHTADVANADEVFASIRGDLLACYKARVIESPNAHAFLVVDIVVAPDGSVRDVETTGGALLGNRTMRCITQRIQRAAFAPVRGGGTLHVQVPLSFTRGPADESI
jgi:hypothetical protein